MEEQEERPESNDNHSSDESDSSVEEWFLSKIKSAVSV